MSIARHRQVCLSRTPYYHCIARCARRAFLCGDGRYFGRNFDHRKHWLVDKLKELTDVFAIEICAYAVMSNHHHLLLYVDGQQTEGWSDGNRGQRAFSSNIRNNRSLTLNILRILLFAPAPQGAKEVLSGYGLLSNEQIVVTE